MKSVIILFFILLIALQTKAQNLSRTQYEQSVSDVYQLMTESKFELAIHQIDSLLGIFTESSTLFRLKGDALRNKNDLFKADTLVYQTALECYNNAIKLDPQKTTFKNYYHRSILYYSYQNFPAALNDLAVALKLSKKKNEKLVILKQRSLIFIYLNKKKEAIKDCKKILELNPESDNTYSNLGLLFLREEEYSKAEKLFKTAIELDSTQTTYRNNLGVTYIAQEKYEEAEKLFSEYLTGANPDPVLLNNRGHARTQLNKFELAKKDIDQSISIYPDNSYAFRNRALLFIKMDNMEAACVDIERSLNLNFTTLYGNEMMELKAKYCQ